MSSEQLFIWILIVGFFIYSILNNKKEINKGKGGDISTFDYWGKPSTHKEDYNSGTIALIIFIIGGILMFAGILE